MRRLIKFDEDRQASIVALRDPAPKNVIETLRVRRDKQVNDLQLEIEALVKIVGDDPRGKLLVARIKSRLIFSVQRLAHHCLFRKENADDAIADEITFLGCCIKVFESALEDLRALNKAPGTPLNWKRARETNDDDDED